VDFYQTLRAAVPKRHRPRIFRIEYASPSFIELGLIVAFALTLRKSVKTVCDSINDINSTYNNIHKGLTDRKLGRLNVRRAQLDLTKAELEFSKDSADRFASMIGFVHMDTIRKLTPNDLVALKVLLSFYRRVRSLAKLQKSGHIKF
jgi:hypothetical protein